MAPTRLELADPAVEPTFVAMPPAWLARPVRPDRAVRATACTLEDPPAAVPAAVVATRVTPVQAVVATDVRSLRALQDASRALEARVDRTVEDADSNLDVMSLLALDVGCCCSSCGGDTGGWKSFSSFSLLVRGSSSLSSWRNLILAFGQTPVVVTRRGENDGSLLGRRKASAVMQNLAPSHDDALAIIETIIMSHQPTPPPVERRTTSFLVETIMMEKVSALSLLDF